MQAHELLVRTSRTFALAIPLLPEPTRRATCLAYLLFRLADTLEDADLWPKATRVRALEDLIDLLASRADALDGRDVRSNSGPTELRDSWLLQPPTRDAGNIALMRALPDLLDRLDSETSPAVQKAILGHARRTANGMLATVVRADEAGHFTLRTMDELKSYCYVVAGIVGELLTELFVHDAPQLSSVRATLVAHETAFGEGLQLVNILKDATKDVADGRRYLPDAVPGSEVMALAHRDLTSARAYIAALEAGSAPPGFVAFTTLCTDLADATLVRIAEDGAGAKVPRGVVAQMLDRVQRSLNR